MTTTSAPLDGGITVSVKDPGQLLAAVPHLLGFRPVDSVVVLGFGGASGYRVSPVLRVDLPPPQGAREAAMLLATVFARQPGRAVAFVIVGRHPDHPPHAGAPHAGLVSELTEAFETLDRPVEHALWTPEIRAGSRWECYDEPRCQGIVPDDASTPVAAAAVIKGSVTFDSREEMERQLEPDDPAAVARRERLLEARIDALDGREDPDPGYAESFRAVRTALGQVRDGRPDLSDDQVVRLALALCDGPVRDACLAAALPPGSENSMRAEALWLELVRRTPAPERAEPAVLLAYSAYMRGDGALARVALENAQNAMPGHVLAELLVRCLDYGMPPGRLRHLGHAEDIGRLWVSPGGAPG